jgi:hypothetical protein
MTNKEPKASDVNNDLIIYRLDEIKGELVEIKKAYVTKEESLALRSEITALREEVHALKARNSVLAWVYPTASAAFTAVFTYLIIEYLKK